MNFTILEAMMDNGTQPFCFFSLAMRGLQSRIELMGLLFKLITPEFFVNFTKFQPTIDNSTPPFCYFSFIHLFNYQLRCFDGDWASLWVMSFIFWLVNVIILPYVTGKSYPRNIINRIHVNKYLILYL